MKGIKTLFLLLLLTAFSYSVELLRVIDAGSAVTDMVYRNGKLYVSTELGKVHVIDLKNQRILKSVELPDIRDFMGNPIPPKIFSVDVSPSGKKMIMVSEASGGYSEVYLHTEGKGLTKLIDLGKGWIIKKGRFVDEDRVVLGFLGDEIALLRLSDRKMVYKVQVGRSSLSDISLSDDRTKVAVSDEAGIVTLVSVNDGKILRKFKGINVDKLYRLDYKGNKILVGGRDRRVALYYTDGRKAKRYHAKFLVFSVGMDSSAKVGAYLYNEQNDVKLIEVDTGREVGFLRGHKYPVGVILFLNGKLLTGCDDGKIFIWRY